MADHGLDEFIGKTMSFGASNDNLAITNISVKVLGQKLFLSGLIPNGATTNNAGAGYPCGVAWDAVTDYMVFNSEADYVKWMEDSNV